jgi:hypothetical protein
MRLRAIFETGVSTREIDLTRTLDPELNYHYGSSLSGVQTAVENVDSIRLAVDIPPQVTRHAGYETSMLETGTVALD